MVGAIPAVLIPGFGQLRPRFSLPTPSRVATAVPTEDVPAVSLVPNEPPCIGSIIWKELVHTEVSAIECMVIEDDDATMDSWLGRYEMPPMTPLGPPPASPQPRPFLEIVDLDEGSSHQEAGQQELAMDFLQDTVGFEEEMVEMQQQE